MKFFNNRNKDKTNTIISEENNPKNSSRDLSLVLGRMNVGFMVVDNAGCIIELNTACMNFLNISENTIGCSYIEILGSHELVNLIREIKKSNTLVEEINSPISRGMKFLASLTYDENTSEILIVLMDTTRIHKLESMRRDFIANISHELRTPLSVIRANAESLVDGALDNSDAAEKFSSAILKNSEKLTVLLSDILNLATIDSGEYSLNIKDSYPGEIIKEIIKGFCQNHKSISIQNDIKENIKVLIDENAFKQVITNLLDNAIKYSASEKDTKIYIRSKNIGQVIRFEIEDRGPGIPSDLRERVFERFFRIQPADTKSFSSVGLGLAIVKNLINLMGGSVGNEAAYPKGTIFWFTLKSTSR